MDNESIVVVVNNEARCLKLPQINDFIREHLFKKYQFFTYLIWTLNVYDEDNNDILYLLAVKVSFKINELQ